MSDNTNIDLDKLQFWAWLEMGINKGWVTEPFCWEDGGDPCLHVIKLID